MSEEIKVGDVVKLKSGGLDMTVSVLRDGESGRIWATCVWFVADELGCAEIGVGALVKVKK